MTRESLEQEIFSAGRALTNIRTHDNGQQVESLTNELAFVSQLLSRELISEDTMDRTPGERALRREKNRVLSKVEKFITQEAFRLVASTNTNSNM